MSSPIEDLARGVRDPEFAKEYAEELAKTNMAVTIAEARKEKGLTQEQLAEKAGASQPYIAKLESGYANPSIGAVAKVLAVMGFRLVPNRASLVPETNLNSKGTHFYLSALAGEDIYFDVTAAGLDSAANAVCIAVGKNVNPGANIILWQNLNRRSNRWFEQAELPRNMGSVQGSTSEVWGWEGMKGEDLAMASASREA